MLPLLVLVVVPASTCAGGYSMWYTGQQTVLGQNPRLKSTPLTQSASSYASGIVALIATYRMHYPLFRHFDGVSDSSAISSSDPSSSRDARASSKPSSAAGGSGGKWKGAGLSPPRTMAQLMKHVGPPTLARVGAVGASFFVAGVVQTYAAITSSE